jgi:hypothetical protein
MPENGPPSEGDVVRSVLGADDLLQENAMSDIGQRLATPEENERARLDLIEGNERARAATRRLGVRPNPRVVAAKLR